MQSHVASIKRSGKAIYWLASSMAIAAALAATGPAMADPLNPLAYPSLGTVTLAPGNYALNSTTLALSGPGTSLTGTMLTDIGGADIAVFSFDSLMVQSGAIITATGTRPVALLSRGNLVFAGTLTANGGDGQFASSNGAGGVGVAGGFSGGRGGSLSTLCGARGKGPGGGGGALASVAGGGGFGGAGAPTGDLSGPVNGVQPNFVLAGGSGAGGSYGSSGGSSGGGAGGGALELGALGTLDLSGGTISANGGGDPHEISAGGSGGGILLHGATVVPGSVSARGGTFGGVGGAMGGGGGRVAIQATANPGTSGILVTGGTGQQSGAAGVISFRQVAITTGNLDFGDVAVGSSKTMHLAVENTGGAGTFLNGELPLAAGPFARVGSGLFSGVRPGLLMSGRYTFTPSATGPFSQMVTVQSNAGPVTVMLSGNGMQPVCRGDFNLDGTFDGQDVQGFVSALVNGQGCP